MEELTVAWRRVMETPTGMTGLVFDTGVAASEWVEPPLPLRKRAPHTAFGIGHVVLCYLNVGRPEAIVEFSGAKISASAIGDSGTVEFVYVNEDVYRMNGIRGIVTALNANGWGDPTYLMVDPVLREFTQNLNPAFLWCPPVANALCTKQQPDKSYAPDYADILLNPV